MADLVTYVDPDAGGGGTGVDWTNAYTSLSACEAAEQADLDGDNDNLTIHCRASSDSADTTKVRFDGWSTSADDDITVTVSVANRHDGTADTGYRVVAAGVFDALYDVREDYVSTIGVASKNTQAGQASAHGFETRSVGEGLRLFDSCLAYECSCHGFYNSDTSDGAVYVNCIAMSNGQDADGGSGFYTVNNDFMYNCVSVNNNSGTEYNGSGFEYAGFGTLACKNCYAGGNDGDDYNDDGGTIAQTQCHSEDATGDEQTDYSTSAGTYFQNITSGSEDVRIGASSELLDAGEDLSEDGDYPFEHDIIDVERVGWSIGAFEDAIGGGESVTFEGTGTSNSDGDGTLIVDRAMVGSGTSNSDGDGTITIARGFEGTGTSNSDGDGSLAVARALDGSGTSNSDGDGSLTVTIAFVGSGTSDSDGDGSLAVARAMDGSGTSESDSAGSLSVARALGGSGTSNSDGDGSLTVTISLIGTGTSESNGDGVITIARGLAGSGTSESNGDGSLAVARAYDGTGTSESDSAGSLSVNRALDGSGTSNSDGDGSLTVGTQLAGTGTSESDGDGVITVARGMEGTATSNSDGDGSLTVARALIGTGTSNSDGDGALTTVVGSRTDVKPYDFVYRNKPLDFVYRNKPLDFGFGR